MLCQIGSIKAVVIRFRFFDDKNVIVEVRGAAGGDEAQLFAGDLYKMYSRYAEAQGWKTEVIEATSTELGGYKEIIFMVNGAGAYSKLKYENGAHRVQRVPQTESGGRIHTSTATVAVLPELAEIKQASHAKTPAGRSGGAEIHWLRPINSAPPHRTRSMIFGSGE